MAENVVVGDTYRTRARKEPNWRSKYTCVVLKTYTTETEFIKKKKYLLMRDLYTQYVTGRDIRRASHCVTHIIVDRYFFGGEKTRDQRNLSAEFRRRVVFCVHYDETSKTILYY